MTRRIELKVGNLRNGHIHLRQVRDLLPARAIGGGNRSAAGKPVAVGFRPGQTVDTDRAGDKMIFRNRAAVREFFDKSGLTGGQAIEFEMATARHFIVQPAY
ncbi:hypothetical protein [Sphingomonas sp.]|uniref:hypothetical protein n=1 Tax=Sphingomonas sp. TaxID=28214 RepID=UPI0035C86A38